MEYPLVDADINIKGLINLLEGCRKSGVKRIIFSSSAAVYGDKSASSPYGKRKSQRRLLSTVYPR